MCFKAKHVMIFEKYVLKSNQLLGNRWSAFLLQSKGLFFVYKSTNVTPHTHEGKGHFYVQWLGVQVFVRGICVGLFVFNSFTHTYHSYLLEMF